MSLHTLAQVFEEWNTRYRAQPAAFQDPRLGSVKDLALAQAEYFTALLREHDLTVVFHEHGQGRQPRG